MAWPAVGIAVVMGVGSLILGLWWGAAFFLLAGILPPVLQQAVRRGWIASPDERQKRRTAKAPRSFASRPVAHKGPLPLLSHGKQVQVRRAVKLLGEAGVFPAESPDPAMLYPGIAAMEESVKPDTIFAAMVEANYYHPDFDPAPLMSNLVLHDTQVEQLEDHLAAQIADLARLSDGALAVSDVTIRLDDPGDGRVVDTHIAMTVNGEALTIGYPGDIKFLSTMIHHALATRLAARGTGQRLAWLWVDQGPWISLLAEGAVERLNDAFALSDRSRCQWAWIDAEAGHAAGEIAAPTPLSGAPLSR